ncbi:MAG: hypothetical protein ACI8RP_002095 [Urechidicola sp.]|jgi:hypothetical protein|tara:strand:- start:1103 stop:1408 length:306 start_codon:yes stop_codon:yes gene_type:complete
MYIYNVTINIDDSIHEPWLKWVDNHIKDVLATKRFISARLTRVLIEEEMGGTTYSVQYTAKTRQDLDNYYKYDAEVLRNNSAIFQGKFVAFRTELEVIKEY